MIKVGITEGDSPLAGELLRILVNHPEVDSIAVASPKHKDQPASSVHFGLIGELPVSFVEAIDPNNVDFLFILSNSVDVNALPEKLKWVACGDATAEALPVDTVCGVSEAFRKPLVRGALHSRILSPISSLSTVMLNPIALRKLIQFPVRIFASLPDGFQQWPEEKYIDRSARETEKALEIIQEDGFHSGCEVTFAGNSESPRAMKLMIDLRLSLSAEEVIEFFESVYDDHNFTFLTDRELDLRDVEGTNKCIIHVSKPDPSYVRVEGIADPYMRGGASEAVHIMNLLCGLHERIGLTFKAISY